VAVGAEETWKRSKAGYCDARIVGDYDEIRYTGLFRGTFRKMLTQRTLRAALAGLAPGSTVLDIPCGTGRFTDFLLCSGYRVMGADISPEMIAEARRKAPANPRGLLGFPVCDVEWLPFADKSIDCTLTARFLHLAPAEMWPRIFAELKRVARSRVVLCVNFDKFAIKHLIRSLRGRSRERWMSQRQFRRMLEDHGLAVQAIHCKLRLVSTLWIVVCRP